MTFLLLAAMPALAANAQVSVSRGADLAVDSAADGRLAIDLLGDLWIVPDGGGEARQLTQNLRSAQRPRWSPDASKLVYQASRDGRPGIWIYDFASGESRNISAEFSFDLHPAWHPGGERIVYSSDRSGKGFDLWEIDLQTGLRWRLSHDPGNETEAAWSSDGRDLVYVLQQAQRWSLILRRHGQPEETLLTSSDRLAAPAWRPDGSLITYFRKTATETSIDMVILSQPRLVRPYTSGENFVLTPVSWLDRQRMIYSAGGTIRQRLFNSWSSRPVNFRAALQAKPENREQRKRPEFRWPDEPGGDLVIHASKLFDGISLGYQYDKDIVIRGGRVAAIEKHADRPGTMAIDLGDVTILPGFVDADARLPDGLSARHGPDLLAKGITTVAGRHGDTDSLNLLWSGRNVPGPRLLNAEQWQVGPLARPELDVTAAVVTSRSTGQPAGLALRGGFRALALAGLTPEQSLRAVGVNAAAALLADPYIGRIATGAAADLVLVDGDPLGDVEDALNVVAVVRNGRFYSVSGLADRASSTPTVE